MPDYNLGTAHGQIQVDYNEKHSKQAEKDFHAVGESAKQLAGHFARLRVRLDEVRVSFGQMAGRLSRNIALMSAGSVALLGLGRSTSILASNLLRLRSGMNIVSALGIGIGGLPARAQGLPNVIRQIILLSSAISLFQNSTRLIDGLVRRFGKLAQSSAVVRQFSARFPALTAQIRNLGRHVPSIKRLGDSANNLARPVHIIARMALVFGTLRQSIVVAKILAGAMTALGAAIAALQGAIFIIGGLTQAVQQLGQAGLMLPGIFFAAAASVGALGLGLGGLTKAFQASEQAAGGAGGAAGGAADAQEAAAEQIRSAKDSLATAEENLRRVQEDAARASIQAARQVADAQKQLKYVREDAARSAVAAARSIRDAERALVDAQRDALRAQEALSDARQRARRELQDMKAQLRGGALDERQAILDLQEAQDRYNRATRNPNLDPEIKEQLLINLEREQLRLEQVRKENKRLGKDQAEAASEGVKGHDAVVSAQENLKNSLRGIRDAQEAVRDAYKNARIDAIESARAIARAERDVADAIRDRGLTEIQNQRAIADATKQVEDAQRALAKAIKGAGEAAGGGGGAAGGMDAFAEAMANISPEARQLVKAILALAPAWKRVKFAVQDALLDGMAEAVTELADIYFPVLEKGLSDVADSINGVAKEVVAFLKQKDTIKDFGYSFELVGDIIDNLKAGVKPLLNALKDIGVVGLEALEDLTKGFGGSMKSFEKWADTARKNGNLRDMIDESIQAIKDLFQIIKNVGSILSSVFGAFAKDGETFLGTVRRVTQGWADFLKSTEGSAALKELATVFRTISGVMRTVLKTAFEELGPVVKELTPFIVDLAKAFGTTVVTAIKILAPILEQIAKALSFLSPVLAPILGGLLGLAIAGRAAKTAFNGLKAVAALLHAGISILKGALWALFNPMKAIRLAMKPFAKGFKALRNTLSLARTAVGVWALDVVKNVKRAAAATAAGAKRAVAALGRWVAASAAWAGNILKNAAKASGAVIKSAAIQMGRWIKLAAVAVARAAVIAAAWLAANPIALIIAAVIAIAVLIYKYWDEIVAFLKKTWEFIKKTAKTVWNAIKDFFKKFWPIILGIFTGPIGLIVGLIIKNWDKIKSKTKEIWNSIKDWISGLWQSIKNIAVNVWNRLKEVVSNAWGRVKEIVRAGISRVKDAVVNGFNRVVDFFSNLPGRILNAIGNLGSLLWDAGKALISGFWDGIKAMFGWVKDQVANKIGELRDLWPFSPAKEGPFSGRGYVSYSGKALMEDFAKAIASREGTVKKAMENAMAATKGSMATSIGMNVNTPGAIDVATRAAIPAPERTGPAPIHISHLSLAVTGNLDPTNPTAWRRAIVNIKDGIRDVERQYS